MSDIKIGKVFDLPLHVDITGVIFDNDSCAIGEICGTLKQSEAVGHAINSHDKLLEQNKALRESLAYAIKEADGWYDDCRGGVIDSEEMTRAKALLEEKS